MSDIFERWTEGVAFLFGDQLISFYTYITLTLAEIAFLWAFFPDMALPFTILLALSIVNILAVSFAKGIFEGTKVELLVSRVYVIVFGIILVMGFFVNWLVNIILFAISLGITALWIGIREFQITSFCGKVSKIVRALSEIFQTKVIWIISQIIVVGIPFAALATCVFFTSMPDSIKFASLSVYALLIPLIVNFEDEFSACTIFELAYDVTWS